MRLILPALLSLACLGLSAQDQATEPPPKQATDPDKSTYRNDSDAGSDRSSRIVFELPGDPPEPPLFHRTDLRQTTTVRAGSVESVIEGTAHVLQGTAETISYRLFGDAEVAGVEGETVASWAVRRAGKEDRFLDIRLETSGKPATDHAFRIRFASEISELPARADIGHLGPGDESSAGFDSVIVLRFAGGVEGRVTRAEKFLPVEPDEEEGIRFQTSGGGVLTIEVNRSGAVPEPVDWIESRLTGTIHPDGRSATFRLQGTIRVTGPDATLVVLEGRAAMSRLPGGDGHRLELDTDDPKHPVYRLHFDRPGEYPVDLEFVADVVAKGEWKEIGFVVSGGKVAPFEITGLPGEVEFREGVSVVPEKSGDDGSVRMGFVPATRSFHLAWKPAPRVGEGKLFFSTEAKIESTVGAGLLRQTHAIDYRILQGQLDSLVLALDGPGEVLDVQGSHVVGWKVVDGGEGRRLEVQLGRALTDSGQISVRTQLPLDAFPVQVEGLRVTPEGAVRHAGFIRLSNRGSVRLEPTGLGGLTQLAPEQFPGESIEARQVFVYRFPAAEYAFAVAADRIQPEVNVSEVVLYRLAETDRVIDADLEFDIREAPIREWDLLVPEDYSVVAVTGAQVADYVAGTESENGQRTLKILFQEDVAGRQLVNLQLEKNEPAAAGAWALPRLEFPEAESVRGDIGIVGAPGFRINASETDLLAEKPLSYFPKSVPHLQQAFRIREPGWSATMEIELLEKSIQTDLFHLYSLNDGTAYGSVLVNYFITGAPVSELRFLVPAELGNVSVEGRDIRGFRQDDDTLVVNLHQPVIGPYTLLVTFEENLADAGGTLTPGRVEPLDVQGERGFLQLVSPMQVQTEVTGISDDLLGLDALELPAEFRLLTASPSLGSWQYTQRPFDLEVAVEWFAPGTTVTQVVEFSEAGSRVSPDGELVSDLIYYVKSRGRRVLRFELPESTRLWAVSVAGSSVTARESGETTLVPLPGGTDPNVPVEVRLRLGRPAVDGRHPVISLPRVDAPVLKTEWQVRGDENHVLVPVGGTVSPPDPVLRPTGFAWLTRRALLPVAILTLFLIGGILLARKAGAARLGAVALLVVAGATALVLAFSAARETGSPAPLQISLPVLVEGEAVELAVRNVPLWRANLSVPGLVGLVAGIGLLVFARLRAEGDLRRLLQGGAIFLLGLGLLLQRDGAPWFFGALALGILLLAMPPLRDGWRHLRDSWRKRRERKRERKALRASGGPETGSAASLLAGALLVLGAAGTSSAQAPIPEGFDAAEEIRQEWTIDSKERRLRGSGSFSVTGRPGDSFLLLRAPATLTRFEAEGLRLTRQELAGFGLSYVITIPQRDDPEDETAFPLDPFADLDTPELSRTETFAGEFEFRMELDESGKFVLPTGSAAVQKIAAVYDKAGWEIFSEAAVRTSPVEDPDPGNSGATLLLAPNREATIEIRPRSRDIASEETRFFVETSQLYVPGPGVVDGRHRIEVRPAQGQVDALTLQVPAGLTVSEVNGPIGSWQFDAEARTLHLSIEPPCPTTFDLVVETQRGLDPLPTEIDLAPLRVDGASGEVGLVALAFGPDAQPERVESETMSAVNAGDFDASLLPGDGIVLHRVFRYGSEGGAAALRIAPVAPEVRVTSKQVFSFGDERLVLAVNFAAEITRAGLFQLSFPLPDGFEVESLSGDALHHWAELTTEDGRDVVLHLNGKTLGAQPFSLTLTGTPPEDADEWTVPAFRLHEATRQIGELVVTPTTGIRLRTVSRQNVSELDPRSLGEGNRGSLAFRLLQQEWNLVLGIEKLDAWITGEVLHEVVLREGQTRATLHGDFDVQNASVNSLRIRLPISGEEEVRTLRATGKAVSDLVRVAPDSDEWELQFKRRIVGDVSFTIEYERRGERPDDLEILTPAEFPGARQLSTWFAVRSGGRLEVSAEELPRGWQRADWNTVPQALREAGNRNAPVLTLRSVTPEDPLPVRAIRHSLAEALKLRVAQGRLTTVLSPLGDQLTAVDLTLEVIQRSSLAVGIPGGGELFSVFVNGESVHSVRQGDDWRFTILPGSDDRTANVRLVFSVPGDGLHDLDLAGPRIGVPLENIQWDVFAPQGFELTDHDGNLELKREQHLQRYDRQSYLSKAQSQRRAEANEAAELLEEANDLLQSGQQNKARWALNNVANRYALDAASNEDARVQLENLQAQQAVVGLNTRRQRLYLDNSGDIEFADREEIGRGAAANPILQHGDTNFRPQDLSELLVGNTQEENAGLQRIAGSLVRHQRGTLPAPQAISITLPEGGTAYSFHRTVQVSEQKPLALELDFARSRRLGTGSVVLALALLALAAGALVFGGRLPAES